MWRLSCVPSNIPQTIRGTCCETIRARKCRKFVRKWGKEKGPSFSKNTTTVQRKPQFSHNRKFNRARDIHPCSLVVFHPFQRVFYVHSIAIFTFLALLSFSLDIMMLKLPFFIIILELFHQNVLLYISYTLHRSFTNLTCTGKNIFGDSTGENLWLSFLLVVYHLFSYILVFSHLLFELFDASKESSEEARKLIAETSW